MAVKATLDHFGRIDVLINNAGYGLFGPFETASDEDIRRQFATNVDGIFNVTRTILPIMRHQKSGTVINVASLGGLIPLPYFSLYSATKFAVIGFTESLSYELAPFGIRVKSIAPGGVATDFSGRSMAITCGKEENAYSSMVDKAVKMMGKRQEGYSTPEDIARVIHMAATDGTDKIMYLAGDDANQAFNLLKNTTEEKRLEMMRQHAGIG